MAKFLYQAKAANGRVQMGQIEALDENDAKIRIKAKSLTPLRVVKSGGAVANAQQISFFQPKLGGKDLLIYIRQFSTLISAGIPIVDALKILSEGKRSPLLKEATLGVKDAIESGKKLSDAMMAYPRVFDRLFVNMIRAGEEAGILDTILLRLAVYMEKSEKIKGQVKSASFYPAMVLVISIFVVIGLLVFIVPKFQDMYGSMGKQLPALTMTVIHMSEFVQTRWYVLLGIALLAPYFLYNYYNSPNGQETLDRFLIHIPLFGPVIQKASVARMTRTLSTLLTSGVSVVDALDIASRTSGNRVVEEALVRSKEYVIAGKPLAVPLAKEKFIPEMVTQMITIGEQSGTLDAMLAKIADFYEDDVEGAVKAMTSMIEPLLMVGIGSIIAFVVAAMYLPFFNMANTIGQ